MATVQFNIPTTDEGLALATEQVTSNPLTGTEEETDDHVLQITFDPHVQAAQRRKSSVVSIDEMGNPLLPGSPNSHHSSGGGEGVSAGMKSSCFVHALLEMRNRFVPVGGGNGSGAEVEGKGEERIIAARRNPPFMTKSELSDMVLGVRELSKHLASIQIKMRVRAIMILTKTYDKALVGYTRRLVEWLLDGERGEKRTVYVEDVLKGAPEFDVEGLLQKCPEYKSRLHYWTAELCAKRPHTFDLVITLGGDGTVLYASWLFQKVVPPVFSFALGSLGFLTKFDFCTFEDTLSTAIRDGVTVGLRLRFEGTVMRRIKNNEDFDRSGDIANEIFSEAAPTHTAGESFIVLNEIVVDRGPNATMSSTELYGDNMHLTTIQADGVCIATPTGSTAYNLAAGGSLCHPEIPAILVSPICAHTLTFRPLILPDSMVVRVAVPCDARTTAWVSFDGRQRIELSQGDYVMISASRFPFPAVQSKPDNKDWFDSIRRTMNWGSRPRQQVFS